MQLFIFILPSKFSILFSLICLFFLEIFFSFVQDSDCSFHFVFLSPFLLYFICFHSFSFIQSRSFLSISYLTIFPFLLFFFILLLSLHIIFFFNFLCNYFSLHFIFPFLFKPNFIMTYMTLTCLHCSKINAFMTTIQLKNQSCTYVKTKYLH